MGRVAYLSIAAAAVLAACSSTIIPGAMDGDNVPVPIAAGAAAADAVGIPAPSTVANLTTADESLALKVEATYRASRTAMELAVDSGALRGAAAVKAANLDNRAYSAVQAMRAAYRLGNADRFTTAAAQAVQATGALLGAIEGNR